MSRRPSPTFRFFGRLRTFDLACPRCHTVSTVRKGRIKGEGDVRAWGWDPRSCTWTCQVCNVTYVLGIVAWPCRPGPRVVPEDAVPTVAQAQALRKLLASIKQGEPLSKGAPINQLSEGPPEDGVWRGLPPGVDLEDFIAGKWSPEKNPDALKKK